MVDVKPSGETTRTEELESQSHFLNVDIFLDVESYTWNRSVEAQVEIIKTLNQIVSNSTKSLSIPSNKIIYLPTGDGICIGLINVNSPYDAPLQIAKHILTDLNTHNGKTSDLQRKF